MTTEYDYSHTCALVLDDNPQMRAILRSILLTMGIHAVAEFSDPKSTFGYLKKNHVDVAVIDLVLNAQVDGLQLASRIRHDPHIVNPAMPIIMVSGYARQALVGKVINAGIDELLTKPLRARDLVARVRKVVEDPRTYIRTPGGYFGPDRRRHQAGDFLGPECRIRNRATIVRSASDGMPFVPNRPDPAREEQLIAETLIMLD